MRLPSVPRSEPLPRRAGAESHECAKGPGSSGKPRLELPARRDHARPGMPKQAGDERPPVPAHGRTAARPDGTDCRPSGLPAEGLQAGQSPRPHPQPPRRCPPVSRGSSSPQEGSFPRGPYLLPGLVGREARSSSQIAPVASTPLPLPHVTRRMGKLSETTVQAV